MKLKFLRNRSVCAPVMNINVRRFFFVFFLLSTMPSRYGMYLTQERNENNLIWVCSFPKLQARAWSWTIDPPGRTPISTGFTRNFYIRYILLNAMFSPNCNLIKCGRTRTSIFVICKGLYRFYEQSTDGPKALSTRSTMRHIVCFCLGNCCHLFTYGRGPFYADWTFSDLSLTGKKKLEECVNIYI